MRGAVKLSDGPGKRKSASGRMILQGSASLRGKGTEQKKQHKEKLRSRERLPIE
jgi:hypothetical protein